MDHQSWKLLRLGDGLLLLLLFVLMLVTGGNDRPVSSMVEFGMLIAFKNTWLHFHRPSGSGDMVVCLGSPWVMLDKQVLVLGWLPLLTGSDNSGNCCVIGKPIIEGLKIIFCC